jgi:hypothetical protein
MAMRVNKRKLAKLHNAYNKHAPKYVASVFNNDRTSYLKMYACACGKLLISHGITIGHQGKQLVDELEPLNGMFFNGSWRKSVYRAMAHAPQLRSGFRKLKINGRQTEKNRIIEDAVDAGLLDAKFLARIKKVVKGPNIHENRTR